MKYQKHKVGERGGLSKSRIERLEAIGFEFEVPSGKSVDFRGWSAKLEALKEFKRKNGHCRVPYRKKTKKNAADCDPDIQSLAKWVEHQRAMYWQREKGGKNSLSDERIAALNALGIEWRVVRSFKTSDEFDEFEKEGLKAEEETLPVNNGVAETAELNAAHQVIDSIPDSIPNLAPASVEVENGEESMAAQAEV
mmetsp:Transcript_13714/g.29117  ORF Transcript_13714/g.29117 Transcript_13714/m.29117 type:complete len:195 (-) Transcript_13714:483-1067(-)